MNAFYLALQLKIQLLLAQVQVLQRELQIAENAPVSPSPAPTGTISQVTPQVASNVNIEPAEGVVDVVSTTYTPLGTYIDLDEANNDRHHVITCIQPDGSSLNWPMSNWVYEMYIRPGLDLDNCTQ